VERKKKLAAAGNSRFNVSGLGYDDRNKTT
jgi:hypothetical protein